METLYYLFKTLVSSCTDLQTYAALNKEISQDQIDKYLQTISERYRATLQFATQMIEKKIEFLPLFHRLLKNIQSISKQLESVKINKADIMKKRLTYVSHYWIDLNSQLDDAKFLLNNWNLGSICELYQKRVSIATIETLMEHNIQKETLKYLSDEDFQAMKISTIGDKLILRNLI